jgi:acetyl-CoA synthetase
VKFRDARDLLLAARSDYQAARSDFRWPQPAEFNWALEWFDGHLAVNPDTMHRRALHIVDAATGAAQSRTFAELSARSNQVANHFRAAGLARGDHLLLLLPNVPEMWEATLAAIKLGVVIIPATTLLSGPELTDRIERGKVRAILAEPANLDKCEGLAGDDVLRITTGGSGPGHWVRYGDAFAGAPAFVPDGPTRAADPMLLYFTSGTTAKPKLVLHTHASYPIGSMSTMYWLGLRPGDVHLNVSSPGWAKHAWSSLFTPWNAEATVLVVNQSPFSAKGLLSEIVRCGATSLCAPPTVWRHLIQEDLASFKVALREVCAAGEPLNPEVIDRVQQAWGLTIRDGYGQTETTAIIANTPGQAVTAGSMGRPLPGYEVRVLDPDGNPASEGEVCLVLGASRPAGLMQGYLDAGGAPAGTGGDYYRTGDVACVDGDGRLTFVGRADDVFKSSDYRISPFELESVLIEHEAVAEAAIIPSPDPMRLSVPKAFVILANAAPASPETAESIFRHASERLAPFKRVRRLEFVTELPKTISGKIRRAHLRRLEDEGDRTAAFRGVEFTETDFPGLRAPRG